MFFTKFPHRSNFSFANKYDQASSILTVGSRQFEVEMTGYEGGTTHIRIRNPKVWPDNQCLEALNLPDVASNQRLRIGKDFKICFPGASGEPVLCGSFGVSGEASMFTFEVPEGTRFFGMGEKSFGKLELSGVRTKFWNTDVWSDFPPAQYEDYPADPSYLSVPYLIANIGEQFVGLLLHNPYPTFIETPGADESAPFTEMQRRAKSVILGSEGGEPNLWVLQAQSLRDLTRKLQQLVGVVPLPPIWALGYHQSRWGYEGHHDLLELDAKFSQHKIPCDALWLDLDYMDGFRVFQTSDEAFPSGAKATAEKLAKSGRRIVPILDPGVKFDPGYAVYDSGHAKDVFCKNVEGSEFIGLVWPGETVFPDFTVPAGREWWAGYVMAFAESGFDGTWIDMNDPSTGSVDPNGMLFNDGAVPHAAHHNQYALGMQMATRAGFLKARPDERPFILSRSGFIGSSKSAAIWTGDNLSNYFHLRISIPTSLGLSLSGVPFNGPDIGGFGGDTTEDLMIDWVKANFLFPFFRNHCAKMGRNQEPFAFPDPVMTIIRRYIRLRYKLMPYLYNLFIDQEELGDPILRPLLYEFHDAGLLGADDQFMVGPWILQAPFLEDNAKTRKLRLPGGDQWYEAASGNWLTAGEHSVKNGKASTPMFLRAGAVVAMQAGTPVDNEKELRKLNIHVFVPDTWSGESVATYKADDGISYAYRSGARSAIEIHLAAAEGNLALNYRQTEAGFGAIEPTFVIHGDPRSVRLNGSSVSLKPDKVVLTGKPLKVQVVQSR